MDIHTATECAYKNGYKAGAKDFAEKFKELLNFYYPNQKFIHTHIDNLLQELTGNEKERLTMPDDYHFEVGV